jgi:GWxTD domain-containing protein
MTLANLVQTPLARALGWTLVHSLWQGAIAALVLLAALFVVRSPRLRYACAGLAMFGTLAGFALTLSSLLPQRMGTALTLAHAIPRSPLDQDPFPPETPARFQVTDALPWLAPFWIAGVIIFHLRSMAGWMAARHLRRRGICRAPDPWQQRLNQLRNRLRLSQPVALLETCLADVPVVIGYLRPVILIPVGLLAGMPARQVESILLHELAHVLRRDYLVNLLQTIAEGFLFYNPAVWWISRVMRAERENCCDDVVVAAMGNAPEYAAALAALEQTRCAANPAALAATGGSLVKRIRRLLYQPQGSRIPFAPLFSAVLLTFAVAGGLAFAWQVKVPAPAMSATQPKVSPYTKWLEEDAIYIIDDRERAAFLSLRSDVERDHFIEQFWMRRDPTPGTPENQFKVEHYRRMAYANGHFAWRSTPGWKTDRGRIYILFGPPDELESHRSGRPAQVDGIATNIPLEQWLYHSLKGIGVNVIMDFTDAANTGEFRMTEDPAKKGTPTKHPE